MLMQVDHDVAFKSEPASVPPRERRGKTGWPRLLRIGGKFAELFPTRPEREAFAKTPEYQEILRLWAALAQADKAAS